MEIVGMGALPLTVVASSDSQNYNPNTGWVTAGTANMSYSQIAANQAKSDEIRDALVARGQNSTITGGFAYQPETCVPVVDALAERQILLANARIAEILAAAGNTETQFVIGGSNKSA